jgi:RNase P/RNase MRP subunit p30
VFIISRKNKTFVFFETFVSIFPFQNVFLSDRRLMRERNRATATICLRVSRLVVRTTNEQQKKKKKKKVKSKSEIPN